MGVLDVLFGGGKKKVHLWALTELGKQKSEQIIGSHGLRLKVVGYLEEYGESTINEIATRIQAPPEQVKATMNQLYRERWVIPTKEASGG